jgi:hypothetical protein
VRTPAHLPFPHPLEVTVSQKTIDRIVELAEGLTPEETAKVAGLLLDLAGVSRETFQAFIAPLSAGDREELTCRLADAE